MRTRHLLRWHFSARDLPVVLACAAIVALDAVIARIEAWVDAQDRRGVSGEGDLL